MVEGPGLSNGKNTPTYESRGSLMCALPLTSCFPLDQRRDLRASAVARWAPPLEEQKENHTFLGFLGTPLLGPFSSTSQD